MPAKRGKVCKSIDDAREALKVIVGPRGTVCVDQRHYERYAPGNRYESVDWSGNVSLDLEDGASIDVFVHQASSAADLVRKLAQALRLAIHEHAERQKPKRIERRPLTLEVKAVRRIEHQPAGDLFR